MTKKIIVIAIAVVLCLSVVGACFALYVQSATKTVTISTGDAVTLTSTDLAGSSIANFTISNLNPNTAVADCQQELRLHASGVELTGQGLLTITASGELSTALNYSYTYHYGTDTEHPFTISETDLANGAYIDLTSLPANGLITFSLDATAYTNFHDIAEKTASIEIKWEKIDFAPVDGAYYLIGSFNGWTVNSGAIALDGEAVAGNFCNKLGVELVEGTSCKIVQYDADAEGGPIVWKNWQTGVTSKDGEGNFVVPTSGNYNIYLKDLYGDPDHDQGWIQAAA